MGQAEQQPAPDQGQSVGRLLCKQGVPRLRSPPPHVVIGPRRFELESVQGDNGCRGLIDIARHPRRASSVCTPGDGAPPNRERLIARQGMGVVTRNMPRK
jgi:hypothetical protein